MKKWKRVGKSIISLILIFVMLLTSSASNEVFAKVTSDYDKKALNDVNNSGDVEAPSAPSNLLVTLSSNHSVELSWDKSLDNDTVKTYEIFCNDHSIGMTEELSYTYSLISIGTYSFYVVAYDQAGNKSGESNIVTVTDVDDERPTTVTDLTIISRTDTLLLLSWKPSSDNVGVVGYKVFRDNIEIGTSDNTSYSDDNLVPGRQYTYTVIAYDASGNLSNESATLYASTIEMEAPSSPMNVEYSDVTDSSVTLSWDASEDNVKVEGYRVYRDKIEIGITTDTRYIDTSVEKGNVYTYMVKAFDPSGNLSEESNSIVLDMRNQQAPTTPANLHIIDKTSTTVTLSWDASTDNGDSLEYMIYQGTSCIGIASNSTNYLVTGLEQGTEYNFSIIAKDLDGNISDASEILTVTTLVENPLGLLATVADSVISICWNEIIGVDSYELSINGEIVEVGNTTIYSQMNFSPNYEYEYKVRSKKGSIYSEWSSPYVLTTGPEKVQNVKSRVINETTVKLTWDKIENATAYEVEINGTVADTVTDNTYTHNNVNTIENNAFYRIRAIRGVAKGAWSEVVSQMKVTIVSGEIVEDTVWDGYIIIDGGAVILEGVKVTINSGTIVKLTDRSSIVVVGGTILAQAEADDPIIMTGINDPEYGGNNDDINADIFVNNNGEIIGDNLKIKLELSSLGSLDLRNSNITDAWLNVSNEQDIRIKNSEMINTSIFFSSSGDLTLTDNDIHNEVDWSIIDIRSSNEAAKISIENNTITGNNLNNGINMDGVTGLGLFIIKNNRITETEYPIAIYPDTLISSNFFENFSDNRFNDNKYDCIYLKGTINGPITLTKNNSYYIPYFIVGPNGSCTIQPGTEFYTKYVSVNGKLVAQGTADEPISFIPHANDAMNYNEYNWQAFNVYGGEFIGDHVIIENVNNLFMSGKVQLNHSVINNSWSLYLDGASIQNTEISNIRYLDINNDISINNSDIYDNGNLNLSIGNNRYIIENNTIKDNQGIYVSYYYTNGTYCIKNNNFINNGSGIIGNYGYEPIKLENNYWGSIYGPSLLKGYDYDSTTDTWLPRWVGSGDKVSGNIDCTPYYGYEIALRTQFNAAEGAYAPTGNYSKQYTDLEVKCIDDSFEVTRLYNSQDTESSGILGKGWSFNYDSYITKYEEYPNVLLIKLPDGSNESYSINEDGTFTSYYSRNSLVKQLDGTYILTCKDSRLQYKYNADGKLIWIKNKQGNALSITYGTNGLIQVITDYVGRKYTFKYENNLLKSIEDTIGRKVNYNYDDYNRLIQAKDIQGIVTSYSYDQEGYLTSIRDGNNDLIEAVTYNNFGGIIKVNQVTDEYGNTKTYSYDEVNGKTTITDSNFRVSTIGYDTAYYETDTTDADGGNTTTIYNSEDGQNKYGEEQSKTDRNGYTTEYKWDSKGNIVAVIEPDTSSSSKYWYDEKNNLISTCDENGNYTYYIYDSTQTYLLKEVIPLNGTDIYSSSADQDKFSIKSYTYYQPGENGYSIKGLLKSVTDPEGYTTTYTYDQYGNIATSSDDKHNITKYTYNSIGLLTSTLSPKSEITTYTYDQYGNLTDTILQGGETTHCEYDTLGRKVKEISPNIYKVSPTGDVGYRYTYYVNGKVHTITDPENNIISYTYDYYGNVLTETKPNGSVYSYDYDSLNRLKNTYFQEDLTSENKLLRSNTYYPVSDNHTMKSETVYLNEFDSATTYYIYNLKGQIIRQINPNGGEQSTVYYVDGTIYSIMDALGLITYYKYDKFKRLSEQWTPLAEDIYSYKKYGYDKNNNRTSEATSTEGVALWELPSALMTTRYTYGANNKLVLLEDAEGGKTEYEYDANDNLTKETIYLEADDKQVTDYVYNYLGKEVSIKKHIDTKDLYGYDFNEISDIPLITSFTYDANGNILTKSTPDNVITSYEYDNLDRTVLETTSGLDENNQSTLITTSYSYDYNGNKLSTSDAKGNVTRNIYDKRGQLVKTIDAKGGITAFYYDKAGRQIAKVDPQSYVEGAALSEMNRVVFTYDNMDRVLLEQDVYYDNKDSEFKTINSKAYLYDLKGRVIKELDAIGYDSGVGATISEKITTGYGTKYTYNANDDLLTMLTPVADENGYSFDTSYTYDAAGRKIAETDANNTTKNYCYDKLGRLIKTTIVDGSEKSLQQNSYDHAGNILKQTDGNGNSTEFTYNKLGLLRSKTIFGDTTIGDYTITNKYDIAGRLVYQLDSMDKVISCTYNNNGQVLSQTEQKKDGSQSITKYNTYDVVGNLHSTTDYLGNTTEYEYDSLNKSVSMTKPVSGRSQKTSYSYDKNGNLLTTTDWLGNTYSNKYDSLNRLISKSNPSDIVYEKYEYDNNNSQIKAIDALGNETIFTYDKNNRPLTTVDPINNVTSQTYDAVGNINSKVDGNANVTTFDYDGLNRLISVNNAKDEVTNYTYDLNGNMLTAKNAKGFVTTYAYNSANKLIKETDIDSITKYDSYKYYPDGTMKSRIDKKDITTLYTYDIHGNVLSDNTIGGDTKNFSYDNNGNILSERNNNGATSFTYDENGRVLSKTVSNIGTSYYTYDNIMDVDQGYYKEILKDPKGNTTEKVYDNLNRLYKVIDGDNESTYLYYENGSVKNVTYSNGCKEEYIYYDNNSLKTLINKKADDSIMDRYSYTYDHAGNQLTKEEIINGHVKGTTSYTYDELSRLVSVMEPNGMHTAYGYDAVGNRILETKNLGTEKVETSYLYTNQNRLVSASEKLNNKIKDITAYTYDLNGNQTASTVASYREEELVSTTTKQSNTYDFNNQLIKTVMSDGTIVNNTYDTEGYRIAKNVNGQATYYLYDSDKVILEQNSDGDQVARNVYGINLLRRTVDSNTYYYMYNGHADVTALLTDTGDVAATYYYDAFGNKLESTGDVNNNILYSGYQYDNETNLYYLNSRMYDPVTARFMQQDTYTGEPDNPLSLNLYTYVTNNPIMYTDPTGHKALRVGSKGDDVKELQLNLISLGYSVGKSGADGKFGPATKAAVLQYQKDNGLKVDGVVGNQTMNSISYNMKSSYYSSYYSSKPKLPSTCTAVQEARKEAKGSKNSNSNNVTNKSQVNPTLKQILKSNSSSPIYKNTASEGQKYYLAWYYGSEAYNRLDEATMSHSSYLVYKLNGLSEKELSKLTVNDVDKMCVKNESFWFKTDSVALAAFGAYSFLGGTSKTLNSVDDIVKNPQSLYGKSKTDVSKILGDGWTEGAYGSSKTGWKFTKGDQSIFYHPGGGRHSGSYYGYSSGATGKIKIVGSDYVPLPGDKARIIHVK